MDEFNKEPNPFDEQNSESNPYGMPTDDPYNQLPKQNVDQYQQNMSSYNMPPQQSANPYRQDTYYNQQSIPQQGYAAPYQGYRPYQQKPSTGLAVASLVLGILSIVLAIPMMAWPFLFVLPIIGLVLGIIFKCRHLPVGKGLSTAGIVTSVCGIVLPILIVVIVVVLMLTHQLDGFMSDMLNELRETSPEQYKDYYDQLYDTFPEWFEGILFALKLK